METTTDIPVTISGRIIAIGDIHGHALALKRLLVRIAPGPDDLIITLGDYIDRGPDSCDVLEILLDLQRLCRLIPLLGNHEEMMLESRSDKYSVDRWRSQGGSETLLSYGAGQSLDNIPAAHWDFLKSCRSSFETDSFLFAHANYCWYSDLGQQPASLLRWTSIDEETPRPHISGKTVILGHTPGSIRDRGFYRCIDTGCGFGGCLTAMDVHTGHFWQVHENGELKKQFGQKGRLPS